MKSEGQPLKFYDRSVKAYSINFKTREFGLFEEGIDPKFFNVNIRISYRVLSLMCQTIIVNCKSNSFFFLFWYELINFIKVIINTSDKSRILFFVRSYLP